MNDEINRLDRRYTKIHINNINQIGNYGSISVKLALDYFLLSSSTHLSRPSIENGKHTIKDIRKKNKKYKKLNNFHSCDKYIYI